MPAEIKPCDDIEKEQLAQIFEIANNAIYFQDSSDYLTVLYAICKIIKPGDETIGDVFIEDKQIKRVSNRFALFLETEEVTIKNNEHLAHELKKFPEHKDENTEDPI